MDVSTSTPPPTASSLALLLSNTLSDLTTARNQLSSLSTALNASESRIHTLSSDALLLPAEQRRAIRAERRLGLLEKALGLEISFPDSLPPSIPSSSSDPSASEDNRRNGHLDPQDELDGGLPPVSLPTSPPPPPNSDKPVHPVLASAAHAVAECSVRADRAESTLRKCQNALAEAQAALAASNSRMHDQALVHAQEMSAIESRMRAITDGWEEASTWFAGVLRGQHHPQIRPLGQRKRRNEDDELLDAVSDVRKRPRIQSSSHQPRHAVPQQYNTYPEIPRRRSRSSSGGSMSVDEMIIQTVDRERTPVGYPPSHHHHQSQQQQSLQPQQQQQPPYPSSRRTHLDSPPYHPSRASRYSAAPPPPPPPPSHQSHHQPQSTLTIHTHHSQQPQRSWHSSKPDLTGPGVSVRDRGDSTSSVPSSSTGGGGVPQQTQHVFAPVQTGAPMKKSKSTNGTMMNESSPSQMMGSYAQHNVPPHHQQQQQQHAQTLPPPPPQVYPSGPQQLTPGKPSGPPPQQTAQQPQQHYPAQNTQGQRICRQCGMPGRYKDGKCVEKWGPGPLGPGTVCDRCRKKMKRVERRGTLESQQSQSQQSLGNLGGSVGVIRGGGSVAGVAVGAAAVGGGGNGLGRTDTVIVDPIPVRSTGQQQQQQSVHSRPPSSVSYGRGQFVSAGSVGAGGGGGATTGTNSRKASPPPAIAVLVDQSEYEPAVRRGGLDRDRIAVGDRREDGGELDRERQRERERERQREVEREGSEDAEGEPVSDDALIPPSSSSAARYSSHQRQQQTQPHQHLSPAARPQSHHSQPHSRHHSRQREEDEEQEREQVAETVDVDDDLLDAVDAAEGKTTSARSARDRESGSERGGSRRNGEDETEQWFKAEDISL